MVAIAEEDIFEVQKEAFIALSNLTLVMGEEQKVIMNERVVMCFISGLGVLDEETICYCLDGLDNLLEMSQVGEGLMSNPVRDFILSKGGEERIGKLCHSKEESVAQKAEAIVDKYFRELEIL